MMNNISIYIHIPFCEQKCLYCNFISCNKNEKDIKLYFDYLIKEILINKEKYQNCNVKSIFIGGGTPSFVKQEYINIVLETLNKNYKLDKEIEITIECNPSSITEEKLIAYKKSGIKRLSIGVQSLNNKCLKIIGRVHNRKNALSAIKLCKKIGFKNINTDILIGIPNQNYFILKRTIKRLIKLKINHISAYMLINEENTPLTKLIESKKVKAISEDYCIGYYNKIYKLLLKHKYQRYEVSNFCIDGYECYHNLNYWKMGEYIGFGLAAHSYYSGERFSNSSTFDGYYNNVINKEILTNEEKIEETIMLGLRTNIGINLSDLKYLGFDLLKIKNQEIGFLLKNGLIEIQNDFLRVTDKNMGVLNQIILKLI